MEIDGYRWAKFGLSNDHGRFHERMGYLCVSQDVEDFQYPKRG
jgi:hypothetical protein